MIELRPWSLDTPRPADAAAHEAGCWDMANLGAPQHPQNVRALWHGEQLVAFGGLIEMGKDGLGFIWLREGAPRWIWRRLKPALLIGLEAAHQRGIRRIFALVAADFTRAIALLKRLGFEFWNHEAGYPNTTVPVLRYLRARPAIEEPALVAHQRRELELACLGAWCPDSVPA